MTITTSFQEELSVTLRDTGLSTDPKEVIGRTYAIGHEEGSHHAILSGTVTALELSDEGPIIKLYVSSPMLRKDRIEYVFYSERTWKIRTSHGNNGGCESDHEIQFALQ